MNIQTIIKEHAFMDVIELLPSGIEDTGQSIDELQLMAIESI